MNNTQKINHLKNVASDYCMDASDVYNILLSKDDEDFPLSFETLRTKVLKDISSEQLQEIFTNDQLKDIFLGINIKKIKNEQIRKLITSFK